MVVGTRRKYCGGIGKHKHGASEEVRALVDGIFGAAVCNATYAAILLERPRFTWAFFVRPKTYRAQRSVAPSHGLSCCFGSPARARIVQRGMGGVQLSEESEWYK